MKEHDYVGMHLKDPMKFVKINKALNNLARRLGNKAIVRMPPIPLYASAQKPGVLLRCLMPTKGKTLRFAMRIEKFEPPVNLFLRVLHADDTRYEQSISVRQPQILEDIELEIRAGDLITLSIEGSVEGIDVCVLYTVDPRVIVKHEELIEEIEANAEEIRAFPEEKGVTERSNRQA